MVQNVWYSNGLPSHMTLPFEYRTPILSVNQVMGIQMVTVFRLNFCEFFQCTSSQPVVGGADIMRDGAVLLIKQGDIVDIKVLPRPRQQDSSMTSQISEPPVMSFLQPSTMSYLQALKR